MAYNFNEIKLEKGMYSERGRSFEQTLEALDPNENYKGTPYEGLDAFQRQLKRFDIKVRGAGSDVVEKFFSTSESAVLFPEYVSRSVKAGMEEGNILPSITATVTRFDGMDYRSIYSAASEDDKSLRYVGEGAAIPQTEVRASDHLVSLKKRAECSLRPMKRSASSALTCFPSCSARSAIRSCACTLRTPSTLSKTATATPTPRPHTRSATTPSAAPKAA